MRTVTANSLGAWSYNLTADDITAMGQGSETLSATATDAAGNSSTAGTRDITVDTLAPDAPVISKVAGDDIVNASEQAVTITGTAEANASLALSFGGSARALTADADGAWSYTLTTGDISAMGQGSELLSITATDAAGNVSPTGTRGITIATVAPNPPAISMVAGDDIVNASEQTVARPPLGFRRFDERGVEILWLMNNPLYGQDDAGAIWYRTASSYLMGDGPKGCKLERCNHDPCIYSKDRNRGEGKEERVT